VPNLSPSGVFPGEERPLCLFLLLRLENLTTLPPRDDASYFFSVAVSCTRISRQLPWLYKYCRAVLSHWEEERLGGLIVRYVGNQIFQAVTGEVTGQRMDATEPVTSPEHCRLWRHHWATRTMLAPRSFSVPGTIRGATHPLGVGMSVGRLLQPTSDVGLI
jgi:hypothetical protein